MLKVGDKVVCVNPIDTLRRDATYTVRGLVDEFLLLEEVQGRWYVDRFNLYHERPTNPPPAMSPPTTSAERKAMPIYRGVLRYAPAALHLVSALSKKGNDKHNPGEEMHHAREKSSDHGDCILRHQMEVGTIDPDTELDHAVAVAWRALMQLQELAESKYGWPKAPGAK